MNSNELIALSKSLRAINKTLRKESLATRRRSDVAIHSSNVLINGNGVMKQCSCGKIYKPSAWRKAEYVGWQSFDDQGGEMRHCNCKSAMLLIVKGKQ